jgi:hypothetical protein
MCDGALGDRFQLIASQRGRLLRRRDPCEDAKRSWSGTMVMYITLGRIMGNGGPAICED